MVANWMVRTIRLATLVKSLLTKCHSVSILFIITIANYWFTIQDKDRTFDEQTIWTIWILNYFAIQIPTPTAAPPTELFQITIISHWVGIPWFRFFSKTYIEVSELSVYNFLKMTIIREMLLSSTLKSFCVGKKLYRKLFILKMPKL